MVTLTELKWSSGCTLEGERLVVVGVDDVGCYALATSRTGRFGDDCPTKNLQVVGNSSQSMDYNSNSNSN